MPFVAVALWTRPHASYLMTFSQPAYMFSLFECLSYVLQKSDGCMLQCTFCTLNETSCLEAYYVNRAKDGMFTLL